MIKLYHCASARSFRALWAMEELGLDYELHMLPFPPRVFKKDYLDINPLGTIPALFDGDTFMTESSAIAQYLTDRYGHDRLGVPVEDSRYGAYLNWLHFGEATLTFPRPWCCDIPGWSRRKDECHRWLRTTGSGSWAGCVRSRHHWERPHPGSLETVSPRPISPLPMR